MIPETLGAAFPQARQGLARLSKAKILQVAFSGLTRCIGKKKRGFSKISSSATGHTCPVVGLGKLGLKVVLMITADIVVF